MISNKDAMNMNCKKQLRKIFIENRLKLDEKYITEKSVKIMSELFSIKEYRQARTVMFYVDARNEVKTGDAITRALAEGKRVLVPKVKKGYGLLAMEIKGLDELLPGTFGILEPVGENGLPPEEIDLVVVPGVAFDRKGHRLGYGGGYYDNFLPKLRPGAKKIAVAFEMQVVENLPTDSHDVKMDMIITENVVYNLSIETT